MDEFEDVASVADRVSPVWEHVIEDMEATAEEYRADGWDALVCHPGDVRAVAAADVEREDIPTGIDVVVPDNEFDPIAAAVADPGEFDEIEVFKAEESGIVFVVAALENSTAETVILVPAYYDVQSSTQFLDMVRREGELRLHVRPLDRRQVLTFAQNDPDLLLPEET